MNAGLDEKRTFLSLCDEADVKSANAPWRSIREQGRRRFRDLPLPTSRTEDWRFTNVAPLVNQSYRLPTAATVDAPPLPPLCHPEAIRLTFLNGVFAPDLSRFDAASDRFVGHLADPGASQDSLARHLAQVADSQSLVFTALNAALFQDGGFLIVPDKVVLERPVEFLYITQRGAAAISAQPRSLFVLGKHSQATAVERFLSVENGTAFTNAVTEIALADGARLDHVKVQQENLQTYHIANTQAVLARGSNFTTHSVLLGGALVRNEVRVRFDDEGCEATVNGLYIARGTQHIDNHTVIDHARPHCNSHELYKGVLADKAHGVFNGKIFVRKDAQKTDAKQTNKVLLLSDDATINTKPQLEIFADDVKCTHGATVGQLDETQTFYLQSRGIGRDEARRILTFAFANDIVGRISLESIREEIEELLINEPAVSNRLV